MGEAWGRTLSLLTCWELCSLKGVSGSSLILYILFSKNIAPLLILKYNKWFFQIIYKPTKDHIEPLEGKICTNAAIFLQHALKPPSITFRLEMIYTSIVSKTFNFSCLFMEIYSRITSKAYVHLNNLTTQQTLSLVLIQTKCPNSIQTLKTTWGEVKP